MDIFCIHLPHRTDRMNNIKSLQKNYPSFNFIVVNGILDENGARGCLLSHQSIIRMAKQQNLPYVWVIEDDCQFLVNNGTLLTHARNMINFMRDTSVEIVNGCGNINDPRIQIKGNSDTLTFLKSECVSTTHCIVYNASSYDKLLAFGSDTIADVNTNACNMLFTYPYLATQLPSYSDIEKKDVVYDNIVKSMNHVRSIMQGGH
jgi:hypothetical protein